MTADRGQRRRRAAAVGVPILVAGVTAGALLGVSALRPPRPAAAPPAPTGTAPVVRTNLTNTVQVTGSLSYAGSCTLVNEAAGTAYTALPAEGAILRRGQRAYEVDGAPVTLFYGSRPEWRALSEGVLPGPDVAQLDRNLIALGFGGYLMVSDYFTAATAYDVELWQQARGLPVTGTVPLGQIVFAPGPLRVTGVAASPGATPQPGAAVLTATSPAPVVVAQLPVAQEYLVRVGDRVTVTLPDGVTTTTGVVMSVSSVATATGGTPTGGASAGPPGNGAGGSQEHGRDDRSADPSGSGGEPGPGTGLRQHRLRAGPRGPGGTDQRPGGPDQRRLRGRGGTRQRFAGHPPAGPRADRPVLRLPGPGIRAWHRAWPRGRGSVAMTVVFAMKDVHKTYPGAPPVHALAAVTLTIHSAERAVVLGPSGSGKTTLLHVAGTLERPTRGSVTIGGEEVSRLSDAELSRVRARRLGFVFQQFHLLDHLDAVQNVALGLLYRGARAGDRRAAAIAALERVGLGHRLAHRPARLSGGERQRVAIARAVAGRPDVVFADEPTGNLDSAAGAEIIALLAGLADDGTAVVVVTHDQAVAAAMDRRVMMRDGRVVSDDGRVRA